MRLNVLSAVLVFGMNTWISFNDRQRRFLLRFMEPFEGKLTMSKYAKMAKCSNDTALRDLKELVKYGIFRIEGVGRGTYYKWQTGAIRANHTKTVYFYIDLRR